MGQTYSIKLTNFRLLAFKFFDPKRR